MHDVNIEAINRFIWELRPGRDPLKQGVGLQCRPMIIWALSKTLPGISNIAEFKYVTNDWFVLFSIKWKCTYLVCFLLPWGVGKEVEFWLQIVTDQVMPHCLLTLNSHALNFFANFLQTTEPQKCYHVTRISEPQTETYGPWSGLKKALVCRHLRWLVPVKLSDSVLWRLWQTPPKMTKSIERPTENRQAHFLHFIEKRTNLFFITNLNLTIFQTAYGILYSAQIIDGWHCNTTLFTLAGHVPVAAPK